MVNSFRELFEDEFGSLMCPLEKVVGVVYAKWYKNIETHIAQYVMISNRIKQLQKEHPDNAIFYQGINHDLGSLIEALRLFCELGVNGLNLDKNHANVEQKLFIDLLKEIHESEDLKDYFLIDEDCDQGKLNSYFRTVIENEIEREATKLNGGHRTSEKGIQQRINRLEKLKNGQDFKNWTSIVIHGVHQFSPLELRFIELLNSLGFEIIFLFNYQPEYSNVYETWKNIYGVFNASYVHAANKVNSNNSQMFPSRKLAESLGRVMEGHRPQLNPENLSDIEYLSFENLTEYTNFVSKHFNKAIANGSSNPLAAVKEKVYSADRQVHDLLRVYYPEQSGDRHFLFYPLGQFFISLYDMWDPHASGLNFNWDLVRECFISGALKTAERKVLLELLDIVQPYLEDVSTYADVMERLGLYLANFNKVKSIRSGWKAQLHKIEFYSTERISEEQITLLIAALEELNSIGKQLFETESGETLTFHEHFQTIRKFMDENLLEVAKGLEKELILSLINKIGNIDNDLIAGSIDDLRQGLYYYLKQQESENPDWIVRNFVQIEGDILRSKIQIRTEDEQAPTYHFGCVSDQSMIKDIDDLLPWPLTDRFIRKAYSPVERTFQVYYAALREYSDFMFYALFYGLYFNQANFRLSYVTGDGKRLDNPFYLLDMLGLKARPYYEAQVSKELCQKEHDQKKVPGVLGFSLKKEHRMNFFLCPHKFLYDCILNKNIIVSNDLRLKRFYSNMLIDYAWSQASNVRQNRVREAKFNNALEFAELELKEFFPFWQNTNDFRDRRIEALNYFHNHAKGNYDDDLMAIRLNFDKGVLFSKRKHPFDCFAVINSLDDKTEKYKYSMWKVKYPKDNLHSEIVSYMDSYERYANVGTWCTNCNYKMICLQSYRESMDFDNVEEGDE